MVEVAPSWDVVVVVVWAWGVGGDALCEDLSCCVLATWVGSVEISVGWPALDAFALGSSLPSSAGCLVPSWAESGESSTLCLLWSSSIASASSALSSVCAPFGFSVGAAGSGSSTVVMFVGMSGGGVGGGWGSGFLSVRRIR